MMKVEIGTVQHGAFLPVMAVDVADFVDVNAEEIVFPRFTKPATITHVCVAGKLGAVRFSKDLQEGARVHFAPGALNITEA